MTKLEVHILLGIAFVIVSVILYRTDLLIPVVLGLIIFVVGYTLGLQSIDIFRDEKVYYGDTYASQRTKEADIKRS